MSTSRPPPIRDFVGLKSAWEAEATSSRPVDFEYVRTSEMAARSGTATPEPASPDAPMTDSRLQVQLNQAQLLITEHAAHRTSLEELVKLLQQEVDTKDAQVRVLTRNLSIAVEQIERQSVPGTGVVLLDSQEKDLAEERVALERDRELFERELDEIDDLKRRTAEVSARESSINQLQEELDRRKVEVGDLESSRAELNEKLRAADAVRTEYKKVESDLRSAKREIKKKSEDAETLVAEVAQLKGKSKKLQERYRILKIEHSDVQGHFTTASEALEERTKELESSRSSADRLRVERDQIKALSASTPELCITSEALLQWLAQDGAPECVGLDEDSQLGWSGVGSYDSDAFDRLLIELGIQQYALPHPSTTHVVVGRVGWSKEDLQVQIDMRQGQTLRVYSQEMLLAALITGRDPLDCEDAEVLDSFKKGHPALEFLAKSELEWPSFSASDTSEIDVVGGESLGVTESPLRALGYKVGETSWLSQKERQEILQQAFEMQHLPWVESDAYMEKWGMARSHQRLWRIAFHLAMLLNGPVGRDWRKPQTKSDWLEDLAWLHEKFYTSKRYRFTWPDVNVT